MESEDRDIAATALRETHEEVGIHPRHVSIAGYLPPSPIMTGFSVTPVVGLVDPQAEITIDPVEVDSAFEVPLEFLFDIRNEQILEREAMGVVFRAPEYHYDGHRIWGATAMMLVRLRKILIKQ